MTKHLTMSLTALLAICIVISPALGADGEDKKKKGKDKVIETLNKVKKLMRDVEQDLAKAGVKPDRKRHAAIRKYIEEQIKAGKTQEEVKKEVEKLLKQAGEMQKSGKGMDKIREELKKLMDASSESSAAAAREITKILEQKKLEKTIKEIDRLIKGQENAAKALKEMDKIFKKAKGQQQKAIDQMSQVIKSAKKMQSMQPKPGQKKEKKPEKKPGEKEEKKPQNSEKEKKQPEKEHDPSKKRPKSPKGENEIKKKTDRWGELPDKTFPKSGNGDEQQLPAKYRKLIEAYRESVKKPVDKR